MKFGSVLAVLLAAASLFSATAQADFFDETPTQRDARLQWWREARFGMFIHWGPVSIVGTEISWSRNGPRRGSPHDVRRGPIPLEVYDNLYKEFNPTNFNAHEWAKIAKDAGMKYMMLTAKHCDGFCLWPTKTGDYYHIGNSPFRRDICGELASAVHKAGLKIGWYYSPPDWRDPDMRTECNALYVARMQTHLRELLSNYGRISLLWFDGDRGPTPWDQLNTYQLIYSLQPRVIINNRLGCATKRSGATYCGDYGTPEQKIGGYDDQHPWETCMTVGTKWAWKPEDELKSAAEIIRILVKCAGGDGNLLLNVGPMPDGRIEPRQVEVLRGVGAWLKKYGESIYGTRGGPWKPGDYGVSTRKGKTIFVHVFRWGGDSIQFPPIQAKIVSAKFLAGGKAEFQQRGDAVTLRVKSKHRQETDTIIALKLDASAMAEPAVPVGQPEPK